MSLPIIKESYFKGDANFKEGFSIYQDILILLVQMGPVDDRVTLLIDNMHTNVRKNLIALQYHKGLLWLFWKDNNIPLSYKEGEAIQVVDNMVIIDVWSITTSRALT